MVSVRVICSELVMYPRTSEVFAGVKTDFLGWIVNPNSCNKSIVGSILRAHSINVSPIRNRSSTYTRDWCPNFQSNGNGYFRILVKIVIASAYSLGMAVYWYEMSQRNLRNLWCSIFTRIYWCHLGIVLHHVGHIVNWLHLFKLRCINW